MSEANELSPPPAALPPDGAATSPNPIETPVPVQASPPAAKESPAEAFRRLRDDVEVFGQQLSMFAGRLETFGHSNEQVGKRLEAVERFTSSSVAELTSRITRPYESILADLRIELYRRARMTNDEFALGMEALVVDKLAVLGIADDVPELGTQFDPRVQTARGACPIPKRQVWQRATAIVGIERGPRDGDIAEVLAPGLRQGSRWIRKPDVLVYRDTLPSPETTTPDAASAPAPALNPVNENV